MGGEESGCGGASLEGLHVLSKSHVMSDITRQQYKRKKNATLLVIHSYGSVLSGYNAYPRVETSIIPVEALCISELKYLKKRNLSQFMQFPFCKNSVIMADE